MNDLKEVRNKINEVDKKIASLFEERMNLSKDVAKYKEEHALPIYDKVREKQVIENNLQYINDDIVKEYYVSFMESVMNISKKYQDRLISGMKVAYSGVEGAFGHIAAKSLFLNQQLISYPSFQDAYESVEKGECDSCVLPLENSYAGDVGSVMDLIFSGTLFINNVIDVDVVHNLIVKKGVKLSDVKRIVSHPQALSQCQNYINSHCFETVEHVNTAMAAKELSESNDLTTAVIASKDVAKLYDLEILESNINEARNNTTRFAVFSRSLNTQKAINRIGEHFILVFTVLNEAGALAKTLNIIGSFGFNMRTLRSRPMKGLQWNYYFFIEGDGDINSIDGQDMIRQLKTVCDRLKVVGTYYSHIES